MNIYKAAKICFIAIVVLFTILGSIKICMWGAYGIKEVRKAYTAKKILQVSSSSIVSKTKDSIIYHDGDIGNYVTLIESMIKTYYPLLKADIGVISDDKPVTVIIYPTEIEMRAAISSSDDNGMIPMGAYTAGLLVILSPSLWLLEASDPVESFVKDGPVLHELVHFVLDEKTKGNYKEWFSEGLALYYENKYTGYKWEYEPGFKMATFKELDESFKYINKGESYRKSYEIIKYIAEEGGEKALRAIYDDLEQGIGLNKAIEKQTADSFDVFDAL